MKFNVTITGALAIDRSLKNLRERYPEALAAALYGEGFELWREAVKRAPVEFTVLRTSAYCAPPTGPEMTVEVGFGTRYAVVQHEHTEFKHPRGGRAKYLESAVNDRLAGMLERIQKRTAKYAKAGVGVRGIPAVAPVAPNHGGK